MTISIRFCVAVFFGMLLSITARGLFAQNHKQEGAIPEHVPYCQIIAHISKYNHRIIQTEAIYRSGGEVMSFYGLSCPSRDLGSWVDYSDDLRSATSAELMETMDMMLDTDGRVQIVALIEFDGPKPVKIPPGTSPRLAALMRGVNSRYGHLNQFRFRVVLQKVISVKPVQPNAPWPK